MKKRIGLIIACLLLISSLPTAVMAEEAAAEAAQEVPAAEASEEDTQEAADAVRDIDNYLWDMNADQDEADFELARTRNYKIIKEMEPLFTEESYKNLYKANVHLNQKKEGAKEEFLECVENLEQVKSVEDTIIFLWDKENMPVQNNKEYSEADLDAGLRFGYGFVPYMISYLQDDPAQAKGNILFFSGGGGDNGGEGFPAAEVFRDLGYNSFVVVVRKDPYTAADSNMDAARAVRCIKYLSEQNGWGGTDMIAMCGFSAGGITVSDVIENQSGTVLPDAFGADYTPDEIDTYSNDINVAMLIYTGHDDPLLETGNWPAFFLCAGSEDGTGATQRLEHYYEQIKDIVPSELHVYEGAGHGFGPGGEGASNTTEEAAHWPEEADRFMQENLGYHQAN